MDVFFHKWDEIFIGMGLVRVQGKGMRLEINREDFVKDAMCRRILVDKNGKMIQNQRHIKWDREMAEGLERDPW